VGYYRISDLGRIFSIARKRTNGGILKTHVNLSTGYLHLDFSVDGMAETVQVHQQVAAAFIGPCPWGYHVNHINGIKADCRLVNLEYATPEDNQRHSAIVLQNNVGEKNYGSKLTACDVKEIRALYAVGGVTYADLAAEYLVSLGAISAVVTRKSWQHVA
jgi:hypothetical protein